MNRRILIAAAACTAVAPGLVQAAVPADSQAGVGRPAPAFEVIDSSMRKRTLAEFKGKTVVLEWSSPSCPFAKAQYVSGRVPKLQTWAERQGVIWLTVLSSHPSRSDYLEPDKAEAFNRGRGGVPSALLIDASGVLGRAYGAKTANHMFIVGKDGTLVYAGGIDDGETMNPQEVLAAHNHVQAALEDIVAGKVVHVATTRPFGCALAYAG